MSDTGSLMNAKSLKKVRCSFPSSTRKVVAIRS